ncbi:MAG: radical SAM protein, partial [Syntrophaceae bacterium]|nr:radical SAM protein [Syntrophaceae bacterium]
MIIPFFIMNRGCRHRCRFCNQGLTAGNHPEEIASAAFTARVRSFLASRGEKPGSVQIAFYGGTFTALPEAEQERLLALAEPFLKGGEVRGIRLSTRPDSLDARRISRLRDLGVTTIEVGAQSMDDRVLAKSDRGHGSEEVRQAVTALREAGIETGLHLMAGLPGDSPELFSATIGKAIDLRPDTVRIHPTLVLRDTPLAEDFLRGHYRPLTLDEAIGWCRQALQ